MAERTLLTLDELPGHGDRIADRLEECRQRIGESAARSNRDPGDVDLLVVSKYVEVDVIRKLWELGVRSFGENRVQEVSRKRETFADLEGSVLHFIGHVQRNKLKKLVGVVDTLHSVDSTRLLESLEERYAEVPESAPDIYVELNISRESQKTGLAVEEVPALLRRISDSPVFSSRLRGLMGMAARTGDPEDARAQYRWLREFRDRSISEGLLSADAGLSMGMSGDYQIAIEEGSTIVRIGSRLFS